MRKGSRDLRDRKGARGRGTRDGARRTDGRRAGAARDPKRAREVRHDLVDAAVLEVHGLVRDQGWLADRALERVLRRERALWASERRAASEALYGLTRWQGQLDWILFGPEAAAAPSRAGPAPDHLALRYAGWLVRFGGSAAGEVARRLGVEPRRLAPLEGADARIAALADPVERLAVEASLPRWLAERFAAELGIEEARALAAAMNERAPLTVRSNALKATRDELAAALRAEGVGFEATPYSPWGLVLDGHQNAFALSTFRRGLFEIQDEASQLVALACGARPGQKVVDACAGAGGKSLALAMEMRNRGELFALDVDADRLEEAKRRARRAGVHNLRARVIAAGDAAAGQLADLEGQADRVLVDAPCSGLGTLRRKPDTRWRLQPGDPERFAALQRELAGRFSRMVKPGGRLVYATCSLGRTENAEVAAFVERELGLAPLPLARALGEDLAGRLGVAGGHTLELWPHRHGTDGFFLACFERR